MQLRTYLKTVGTFLAIVLFFFQLYGTAGFGSYEGSVLRTTHLALILALVFLWIPAKKSWRKGNEPILMVLLDICLAIIALGTSLYVIQNLDAILERMRYVDPLSPIEYFFGISAIVLTMEATRRTSGLPLVLVGAVSILYALCGQGIPGLGHQGVTLERLVEQMYLLTDGIYGIPLAAACTMVYAFILFGACLERSHMNNVFMDLACMLTKNAKGGPAKVSIFASALFGSISGNAVSNVYGTGVFSIPLMKRVGYAPHFAGAVEASASTGGQLMPPVMGSAAFIMADLTGAGYLAVAKAALIPSIMFYFALWCMIHFEASRHNIGSLPADEIPETSYVMRRLYYLFPIIFLILILCIGYSVGFAAYTASLSVIILAMFGDETRLNLTALKDIAVMTARNAMMVSTCCACAGILVGVISLTGLGFKFINLITSLAGGSTFLLMVYIMITCTIVGMGIPTAPAYIVVASLGAPALIKAGLSVMASHMFVMYYAVLSSITPPVCMAAFAGAALAEADAMKTGFTAMRISIVAFIVPYFFILEPSLIMEGGTLSIMQSVVTSLIGIIGIAAGIMGYLVKQAPPWQRLVLFGSGLCLIFPGSMTDIIGLVLFAVIVLLQLMESRKQRVSA